MHRVPLRSQTRSGIGHRGGHFVLQMGERGENSQRGTGVEPASS
jgi:hypothetical protein